MIRRHLTVFALGLMLSPWPAYAQNSGTEAEQEACTPDVFRLCQDFIPNEVPIVACLKAKRAQLSSACSLVMYPRPAAGARVRTAAHRSSRRHHRAIEEAAR